MRTIRIIHGADFRLDAPYEALNSSQAAVRRGEQAALLSRLVQLAEKERADLMLLCGALAETEATAEALVHGLEQASCPVILASERAGGVWTRIKLPENITILSGSNTQPFSIPSADSRIYRAASGSFRGFHAERRAGTYNILCLNSRRDAITEEDIAASGTDYVALGYDSTASGLLQSGGTWYSWPGCPEGRGFDECGEKTVNVVELSGDECKLRRESISIRRYQRLTLDISEKDPLLLIHTSLPDDTIKDSYRIVLTGETETAPDLRRLVQNLEEMFFSLQLVDRTRLCKDIWESACDDTLRGLLIKKLRARYDTAANEAQRMRIEQAVRWGLAALDNGEEVAVHENS